MGTSKLSDRYSWPELCKYTSDRLNSRIVKFPYDAFYKWMFSKQSVGYPFDPTLIFQCYKAYRRSLNDYDNFIAVCGYEGTGKSTLARNMAYFLDPNFDTSKIVFTLDEYLNLLEDMLNEGKKGGCIVIDEGGQLMFSRDAMSATNKILVRTAMLQRKINVTVIICIPNFFLLDTYIRNSRVNLLIQISDRGEYKGILKDGLTKVSADAIKYKNVLTVKLMSTLYWKGSFNTTIPKNFSVENYEEKKDKYMKLYFKDAMGSKVQDGRGRKLSYVARDIGCSVATLRDMVVRGQVKGFKVNKTWYIDKKEIDKLTQDNVLIDNTGCRART